MAHATGKEGHAPVTIRADHSRLSREDQEALALIVTAAQIMNIAYRKQRSQASLETHAPFDPEAKSSLYPDDATKEQLDDYLKAHPDEREALLSPFSAVRRTEDGFNTVAFSELYASELQAAADALDEAAGLVTYPAMRTFLRSRANAFRTNQYRESDMAWISANDAPFEVTIGPYESYQDKLYGMKRMFEAVVGIVREDETAEALVFQEQILRFDAALGNRYGYETRPTLTPMQVVDALLTAGESLYEYVPMAYNLPNDRDIHQEAGSKKVFLYNIMEAKLRTMTLPIAERVLDPALLGCLSAATMHKFIVGHEGAHGLSFHFSGEEFESHHSSLEEGKADVFGLLFLYFLADEGLLPLTLVEEAVIGHFTDGLRQIRFGIDEAHAVGSLIQYNWLLGTGAIDIKDRKLSFNRPLFRDSLQGLGDSMYALSQTRSVTAAVSYTKEHGQVPAGILELIEGLGDIPIDIDPQFEV